MCIKIRASKTEHQTLSISITSSPTPTITPIFISPLYTIQNYSTALGVSLLSSYVPLSASSIKTHHCIIFPFTIQNCSQNPTYSPEKKLLHSSETQIPQPLQHDSIRPSLFYSNPSSNSRVQKTRTKKGNARHASPSTTNLHPPPAFRHPILYPLPSTAVSPPHFPSQAYTYASTSSTPVRSVEGL